MLNEASVPDSHSRVSIASVVAVLVAADTVSADRFAAASDAAIHGAAHSACVRTCTRRNALKNTAIVGAGLLLSACGTQTTSPVDGSVLDEVVVTDNDILVRLNMQGSLARVDSALVLGAQNIIVLRVADTDYRAFTNVCTHSGCGIFVFRSGRMLCQCHGSEFDINGTNVAGPAPTPLRRYPVVFDAVARTVRINRALSSAG